MGKQLLGRTKFCAIAGVLAWSHPALAQNDEITAFLNLGNNLSFNLGVTNDLNVGDIESVIVTLNPGSQFDLVRDASTVPDVGGNNDGNESNSVTIIPDMGPIPMGSQWTTSGDIDGSSVSSVSIVANLTGGNSLSFDLAVDPQGDSWLGMVAGTLVPPDPGPDLDLDCSDLLVDGCEFYPVATLWTYTGTELTLQWQPDPDDMFRRDRMLYRLEVRNWPEDVLVDSRQTMPAEETFLFTSSREGHFHFLVSACDPDLIESGDLADLNPAEHCSVYADSMNDFNTPAELPGFMVYVEIAPVSGGGIE